MRLAILLFIVAAVTLPVAAAADLAAADEAATYTVDLVDAGGQGLLAPAELPPGHNVTLAPWPFLDAEPCLFAPLQTQRPTWILPSGLTPMRLDRVEEIGLDADLLATAEDWHVDAFIAGGPGVLRVDVLRMALQNSTPSVTNEVLVSGAAELVRDGDVFHARVVVPSPGTVASPGFALRLVVESDELACVPDAPEWRLLSDDEHRFSLQLGVRAPIKILRVQGDTSSGEVVATTPWGGSNLRAAAADELAGWSPVVQERHHCHCYGPHDRPLTVAIGAGDHDAHLLLTSLGSDAAATVTMAAPGQMAPFPWAAPAVVLLLAWRRRV